MHYVSFPLACSNIWARHDGHLLVLSRCLGSPAIFIDDPTIFLSNHRVYHNHWPSWRFFALASNVTIEIHLSIICSVNVNLRMVYCVLCQVNMWQISTSPGPRATPKPTQRGRSAIIAQRKALWAVQRTGYCAIEKLLLHFFYLFILIIIIISEQRRNKLSN